MKAGADPGWPWVVSAAGVALLFVVGLLGAFTIGVFVLPLAVVAAVALVGVRAWSLRGTARPAVGPPAIDDGAAPPAAKGARTRNPLATISLASGISSAIIGPLAFVGLITGIVALREIGASGGAQTGSRRAKVGIAVSAVGILAYVLTLWVLVLRR